MGAAKIELLCKALLNPGSAATCKRQMCWRKYTPIHQLLMRRSAMKESGFALW